MKDVHSIGVLLFIRNNGLYLQNHLFPMLQKIEALYSTVSFSYYIFENDSTDNSKEVVQQFMDTRQGSCYTEQLHLNCIGSGTSFARIQRIAHVRNMLLGRVRDRLSQHQWCWFIDSDIFFDEHTLQQMFDKHPGSQNIGMMGCVSIELAMNDGTLKDVPKDVPYLTQNHYYDTFAYTSIDDIVPYPACLFPECVMVECKKYRKSNPDKSWNMRQPFLDVRSAWGGFVLIEAEILCHPGVSWKPLCIHGGNSVCEHVYFCDVIKASTQKRIVIVSDVNVYWMKENKHV